MSVQSSLGREALTQRVDSRLLTQPDHKTRYEYTLTFWGLDSIGNTVLQHMTFFAPSPRFVHEVYRQYKLTFRREQFVSIEVKLWRT